MRWSALLLLIAAFVLNAAIALPLNQEESEEVASSQDAELGQQDPDSSIEDTIQRGAAKVASSSSEELNDGAKNEVKEKIDSSQEAASEEEKRAHFNKHRALETHARRSRSAEEERYRNLYNLALICPKRDTTNLEKGNSLNSHIEIADIYTICSSLPEK
ncbi:uncharacterized protein LOC108149127 [Drosophila elegans]|uniref:uncharacterized protein LOC108149127 n=1 Tax=Drosophila elegans TaxID=30023 RepID=UPI0007E81A2B|nr:uncharacterized protein LOC108149127 [Drosophila elegans]